MKCTTSSSLPQGYTGAKPVVCAGQTSTGRQRGLHIQRNIVKLSRQPILIKEPKTRAGMRVVYLSKDLCKQLWVWEEEFQWEKKQQGVGTLTQDDYLF